jgi:hypothetical protein
MGKSTEQGFSKEEVQISKIEKKKDMKKCSIYLAIKEM